MNRVHKLYSCDSIDNILNIREIKSTCCLFDLIVIGKSNVLLDANRITRSDFASKTSAIKGYQGDP